VLIEELQRYAHVAPDYFLHVFAALSI